MPGTEQTVVKSHRSGAGRGSNSEEWIPMHIYTLNIVSLASTHNKHIKSSIGGNAC